MKSWIECLASLRHQVLRRVIGFVLLVGIYAAGLVLWELQTTRTAGHEPNDLHTFFGAVLGIVLVFRTNTAYDRWWEGRKLWGQLINDSRNFAIKLQTCVQASVESKHEFAQWLKLFPVALKEHLRGPVRLADLPGFETTTDTPAHVPAYLAQLIYQRIEHWRRADQLGGFELLFLDRHAAALMEICGACERIHKTPIATSYLWLIRQAIALYLLVLPYGIVTEYRTMTIFIAMVVAYFMIGLELLAESIEDPFGTDIDDLPLDRMSATIARSIDDIMSPSTPSKNA